MDIENLHSQLEVILKIRNLFQLMNIQMLEKKGLANITINNGYKNVIDEALPVFKNLNVPITIFINSSLFDNKVF